MNFGNAHYGRCPITFLERETEGHGRQGALLGKRLQRRSRSRVSQLFGSPVETDRVAAGPIIPDLPSQTHHRIRVPQSYSFLKQLHGLSDTMLSALRVV